MTTNITFRGRIVQRRDDESVLDALIRGGTDAAYSCRKGSCQTCLLRVVEGDPGRNAQRALHPDLVRTGHFKPCVCFPPGDLVLAPADRSVLRVDALVSVREELAPGLVRLRLESETELPWSAGQHILVEHEDGSARPWTLASVRDEDWFLDLHVDTRTGDDAALWLAHPDREGTMVRIHAPRGALRWEPSMQGHPLSIHAADAAAPAALGLAREALRAGHTGPITLHLRLPDAWRALWQADEQALIQRAPERVSVVHNGPPSPWDPTRDVVIALGPATFVARTRVDAVAAGVPRARILAEPWGPRRPGPDDDDAILDTLQPDPELWHALGHGPGLRAILEDFYQRVYADERLAPFFHNATLERAIDKQYSFLSDLFSGRRDYFGLKPFNAHHWMVISDELFDYREALFESCARRWGLPEHLLRRWSALHERFRITLVKDEARGMFIDGVEVNRSGFSTETLDCGTLCDGCMNEIAAGTQARMHNRTGQLYCFACEAGSLLGPPG